MAEKVYEKKGIDITGLSGFLRNLKLLFVWKKGEGTGSVKLSTGSTATGNYSVSIGNDTDASGACSHSEGYNTTAYGDCSHVEGSNSRAFKSNSHAEGESAYAQGNSSHAEGYYTTSYGVCSHSEGNSTYAKGDSAHAEGYTTNANGAASHTEGWNTKVYDDGESAGGYSHAEGVSISISGSCSHAGGHNTYIRLVNSLAHGEGLQVMYDSRFAFGKFNSTANTSSYIGIIGRGTSTSSRQTIAYITTAGTWYQQSDERLKDDISDISEKILSAVDKVKFKQFTIKQDKEETPNNVKTHYGVIAQDVIKALSDYDINYKETSFIDETEEHYYGLNYTGFLIAKCALYEKKIAEMEPIIKNYLEIIRKNTEKK